MKKYIIFLNGKAVADYQLLIAARQKFFEIARDLANNYKHDILLEMDNLTTGENIYKFEIQ